MTLSFYKIGCRECVATLTVRRYYSRSWHQPMLTLSARRSRDLIRAAHAELLVVKDEQTGCKELIRICKDGTIINI